MVSELAVTWPPAPPGPLVPFAPEPPTAVIPVNWVTPAGAVNTNSPPLSPVIV